MDDYPCQSLPLKNSWQGFMIVLVDETGGDKSNVIFTKNPCSLRYMGMKLSHTFYKHACRLGRVPTFLFVALKASSLHVESFD
jgi:hypothetical protein